MDNNNAAVGQFGDTVRRLLTAGKRRIKPDGLEEKTDFTIS